jgi:hypothetical protein
MQKIQVLVASLRSVPVLRLAHRSERMGSKKTYAYYSNTGDLYHPEYLLAHPQTFRRALQLPLVYAGMVYCRSDLPQVLRSITVWTNGRYSTSRHRTTMPTSPYHAPPSLQSHCIKEAITLSYPLTIERSDKLRRCSKSIFYNALSTNTPSQAVVLNLMP